MSTHCNSLYRTDKNKGTDKVRVRTLPLEVKKAEEMISSRFTCFTLLVFAVFFSLSQVYAVEEHNDQGIELLTSSPFESALQTLQKQICYTFKRIGLLRRAMTHASFSEENNRALSMLGTHVIEAFVSLQLLLDDIDTSPKDLDHHISEISNVDSSCAVDGMRLGLQKVVRISPKTNSTTPSVVCGAFRAIFGAIATDTEKSDDAGGIFWKFHHGEAGKALAL